MFWFGFYLVFIIFSVHWGNIFTTWICNYCNLLCCFCVNSKINNLYLLKLIAIPKKIDKIGKRTRWKSKVTHWASYIYCLCSLLSSFCSHTKLHPHYHYHHHHLTPPKGAYTQCLTLVLCAQLWSAKTTRISGLFPSPSLGHGTRETNTTQPKMEEPLSK